MRKVLIAGATGYLGQLVAKEFKRQDYFTRIIARNVEKFKHENIPADELIKAEFTKPETLIGCCENIDVVFTSVGITKQKDGLTYMDVDYQANLNLLEEAKRSGVKKFMLWLTRTFTSSKTYGPIEFFITVLSMDMVAPNFGKYKLKAYFDRAFYSNRETNTTATT